MKRSNESSFAKRNQSEKDVPSLMELCKRHLLSPEALYCAKTGSMVLAARYEEDALPSEGYLPTYNEGSHANKKGKVLASLKKFSARLESYCPAGDAFIIKVDKEDCLEFWLKIVVPCEVLRKMRSGALGKCTLECRGRIWKTKLIKGDDHDYYNPNKYLLTIPVYNKYSRVDGAVIECFDAFEKRWLVKVRHSECPEFWLDICMPLEKIVRFVQDFDC